MARFANITVSGPGQEPRAVTSVGAGVNFAQRLAEASRSGSTFYVRDEDERVLCRVERQEGVVLTYEVER